jgi:hypothetical protein
VSRVLETVFGLPTHVLVVHGAVVLLPLASVTAVVMAISFRFCVRFGPLVVAIAGLGLLFAVLSRQSGEVFALVQGVSAAHQQAGNWLPLFAAGLLAVVLALWLTDRRQRRGRTLGGQIIAVLVVAVAVLTTGWTIRTGHTGAEMVWL